VRRADNLPSSCVVMKSGNLNFLEPSGPLQACNGTALPLPIFKKDQSYTVPPRLGLRGLFYGELYLFISNSAVMELGKSNGM
jgi:hypothetical protein